MEQLAVPKTSLDDSGAAAEGALAAGAAGGVPAEAPPPPGGGGGGGGASAPMQCVMKFLTPEVLAAAVIGKGGSIIAAMRQSCQAKIALTDHGDFYPQTDCRVLTAQAGSEEALAEVTRQLVAKIDELAKGSQLSEAVGIEGELRLRTLVPRAAVGGIIGKGGSTIKQIRETSGAKISISEPAGGGPAVEQTICVSGSAQALEYVLQQVNRQIQMLSGESWFTNWATSAGVTAAPALAAGGGFATTRCGNFDAPGVGFMIKVAQGLPPYVMEDERGFALSCVVPNRLVGGIIGRAGAGTKEVQVLTGTKISIRDIAGDYENRALNITGPLASTCAAYMLMMKRYLDSEAQSSARGSPPPG